MSKSPLDRIVGPDGEGEWPDGETGIKIGKREEFLVRCLNAAVNLYGVLTYGAFCELYNHYAKSHDAPVSDPLGEEELDDFIARVDNCKEGDGTPMDKLLDEWGACFSRWIDDRDGARLVVRYDLIDAEDDVKRSKVPPTQEEIMALVSMRVAAARDELANLHFPTFDEEAFLSMQYIEDDFDIGANDVGDDDGEPVRVEDLPPAKLTGPFDFKSVKDPAVRDKLLWAYEGVRIVTREFVIHVVMRELTGDERRDAATRLGFELDPKTGFVIDKNLDMVAGDFASMMDDQHGEPAIKRVLKRKDKIEDELDRAAAEYYENYRYTWLEVLAVKSGLGMKCRDLMTGEDIFLVEKSMSMGNVKGMTICVGIAPMGEVYFGLGVAHPANFENPSAVMKIVLTHLGLPTALPVRLSFSDQARFAAETIRRINAIGRFHTVAYGGLK